MKLYTKKRKIHQANFLLLHCFENALRSTLCVKIAKLYNTSNSDSWFLNRASSSNGLNNLDYNLENAIKLEKFQQLYS